MLDAGRKIPLGRWAGTMYRRHITGAGLLGEARHGFVHEEGNPFLGGRLIPGVAAAQFHGAVRGYNEFRLAEGGDETFRFCADEMFDAIIHAPILTEGVGQRLSKSKNAKKGILQAGRQSGGV